MKKNIQHLYQQLKTYKVKRIEVEKLIDLTGEEVYSEAATLIQLFVSKNWLKPIESSKDNGRYPRLFKRYTIQLEEEASTTEKTSKDINQELLTLHPKIKVNHYRQQTKLYLKHREIILAFSDFLKRCDQEFVPVVAVNERSFELFKSEKMLQSLMTKKASHPLKPETRSSIMMNLGLTYEDLKIYETDESFFYTLSPLAKPPYHWLIVENKDTFVTLQKLLIQNGSLTFPFGTYHGVNYGEGFKIINSLRTIFNHYDQAFHEKGNQYSYIGDLDYAGLSIYLTLTEAYQDYFEIQYLPHYFNFLIETFYHKFPSQAWPLMDEKDRNQKPIDDERYQFLLPPRWEKEIKKQLKSGAYLPQEVMSYADWMNLMKAGV